ncbi:MAG: hypothetical protein H6767_03875 [Candidatus Peribacteria bacterium]|nr:MAG: hypothetical protein H6767_03875 [Candidatus Peribacteria bacterium]
MRVPAFFDSALKNTNQNNNTIETIPLYTSVSIGKRETSMYAKILFWIAVNIPAAIIAIHGPLKRKFLKSILPRNKITPASSAKIKVVREDEEKTKNQIKIVIIVSN